MSNSPSNKASAARIRGQNAHPHPIDEGPKIHKLAMKRFGIMLIPLTLISIAAFSLAFTLVGRVELAELDGQIKAATELARSHAKHDFETVYGDLQFVVDSEQVNLFLSTPDDRSGQQDIERSFLSMTKTHKIYDQVRLLSNTGQELIRVNYNQGSPEIVPRSQLQDKSTRYYFLETAKITDDRIFVSKMDLNIENGKIEQPYKPMVRFAQPVKNPKGEVIGIVILNYLGDVLLNRFRQQMSLVPGKSMLLNHDGYWLSSNNNDQEWGFMFASTETFASEYPTVWQQVAELKNGIVDTEHGRFSFASVNPMPPGLLANTVKPNALDDWTLIFINRVVGFNKAYLLELLSSIYPLLVAYPIGLMLLWLWAKASSGRKIAEQNLHSLNNSLEGEVKKRTEELQVTKDVIIFSLANLAEIRDNETGQHIRRTQNYIRLLANSLKTHPDFKHQLDGESIEMICKSATLHDIGKVGIPDAILLKPGRLSDEEFEIMKKHTTHGHDALEEAINLLASSLPADGNRSFLQYARDIAHYHHEKWDGSGYPKGLCGDTIPLAARLMALADVYDALLSKRVYKLAFSREESENIILKHSEGHFDPRILKAFESLKDEFWAIRLEYDEPPEPSRGFTPSGGQAESLKAID